MAPQAKFFRTQTKGAEIDGLSSSICTANGGQNPLEIDPPPFNLSQKSMKGGSKLKGLH